MKRRSFLTWCAGLPMVGRVFTEQPKEDFKELADAVYDSDCRHLNFTPPYQKGGKYFRTCRLCGFEIENRNYVDYNRQIDADIEFLKEMDKRALET